MSLIFLFLLTSPLLLSVICLGLQSEVPTPTTVDYVSPSVNTTSPTTKPTPPTKLEETNTTLKTPEQILKVNQASANLFPFLSKTALGDKCTNTDDCKPREAFCIDGTCQCSSEYVASANNKKCLIKARKLLDNCIENVQCEAGMNATGLVACISYKCFCALDTHMVEGKCYKKKVLGNDCDRNEECSIPFSSCIQGVCACIDNMEPNENDSQCVVMKAIGAVTNCTDDHACSKFGEFYRCEDGACVCRPGYYYNGFQCTEEKRLGDHCDRPEDCLVSTEKVNKRTCKNKMCSCIGNFAEDITHNLCKSGASVVFYNIIPLVTIFLYCIIKNF